ncbi:MAG: DUF3500 domain-containing protein [Reyranella sp.]|uniref:DUF3500 domain-containing protein n=1 Tax=Reyranella sp. TaxID=1929291 RepID=UPI0011FF30F0|nr:DUF3500 domain-containing protein [Reyranella sp.]TAJ87717.1 MAG: DUF3500 domain-containing protein [Reyranella sp.]TBR28805.1 MAG: DUF3500 domain-containing protein [Reyranella sp.]
MPHDGWHPHDETHDHHHRHGPPKRRTVLAAAALLPFGSASAQTVDAAQRIADAANRFLLSLDDGQRQKAMIAFESGKRLDWHYIPRSRSGLSVGEMRSNQADAARALFASVLSQRGLELLDGVRLLEGVLREQQGSFRDPGRYYVSVFGTPGRFPWGWRFEGHHLSLNVALPAPGHVSVTPFFAGAHPATVRDGPNAGFRLLGASEDIARRIMAGLDEQQRQAATIANRSFGEIVASPQREQDLGSPKGLLLGDMTGAQRTLLEALMDRFLGTLAADLLAKQKQRVLEQGLPTFRFAWAGSLTPGEAHYFRLHGPATLIEHDNTQNSANHIHAVWRDLAADFGRDTLADHYRQQKHR